MRIVSKTAASDITQRNKNDLKTILRWRGKRGNFLISEYNGLYAMVTR